MREKTWKKSLYQKYKEAKDLEKLTMDQLYKKWLEYKTAITESPNTIKRHKQHYRKYF